MKKLMSDSENDSENVLVSICACISLFSSTFPFSVSREPSEISQKNTCAYVKIDISSCVDFFQVVDFEH